MTTEEVKKRILHYQKKFKFDLTTGNVWPHGFICGLYDRSIITEIQLGELLD